MLHRKKIQTDKIFKNICNASQSQPNKELNLPTLNTLISPKILALTILWGKNKLIAILL